MPEQLFRFVEALRQLLEARSATGFEARWRESSVEPLAWEALRRARSHDVRRWELALDEADGFLLRLLDRVPILARATDPTARRIQTFRMAALERMQHATAAALVAQRYGAAGLRTVVDDEAAPIGRRYFAFLALAERHRRGEWPLFARYLTPDAHHAFVGTAAEATRFYPELNPAPRLVALFEAVRPDLHLREFLSPRILESLYVLNDRDTLPFARDLLTAGHTHHDPPVMMLIVIPALLAFAALNDPDGSMAVALTLIPFSSPIAMPVRWAAAAVPVSELVASVGFVIATATLVTWVAAKIYRVGILMYGKRPGLRDLIRWVRAS